MVFYNISCSFHIYSFSWRAGAKEAVEKAKVLCLSLTEYIMRYQSRGVPAPEHALLLGAFIFPNKEEIPLQMCVAMKKMVWCGVWCSVMWCDGVWCSVVWCNVVWCSVVWCGVVYCGVVWCCVVR